MRGRALRLTRRFVDKAIRPISISRETVDAIFGRIREEVVFRDVIERRQGSSVATANQTPVQSKAGMKLADAASPFCQK